MPSLRTHATHWFERRWYGAAQPGVFLGALSRLFRRIAVARRERYLAALAGDPSAARHLPQRAEVPVIVVGNLAIGGAGKTPLTIALAQALSRRGFRPGVISRGYGRRGTTPHRVQALDTPATAGDEPLLISRRAEVPVAVAARRIDAARLLTASGDVDVLIADDGLQHYALARDIEILVIDGVRRLGNARMLPAGPLREPASRRNACDFVVHNGGAPAPGEIPMRLELLHAHPLAGGAAKALETLAGQKVHAVAGIGHPERFFNSLRELGLEVEPHAFADHHTFSAADLDFSDQAPVLMTEKDAVKCTAFAQPHWYAVPASARLPEAFFDAVAARLTALQGGPDAHP
ncbi:MAG: tetraacyldisaccharide 4'-kinase [Lysobacteraceae bacterium]